MNIFVTGATGFVGHALATSLHASGDVVVRVAVRSLSDRLSSKIEQATGLNISADTDWHEALIDVDCVVHLAAIAASPDMSLGEEVAAYRRVNVDGALNLARQAASVGAKRFVFVSSVKVNGELTLPGQVFTAEDVAKPEDAYGRSKHEAERGLLQIAQSTGMEVVIIRPPLIYGPGVKANFRRLMAAVYNGTPLPLGAVRNKRSMVSVDNLIDLIRVCLEHPAAANQVFMVSDGEDLSTTALLRRLALSFGKPSRLLPVPVGLMQLAATLLGKRAVAQRVFGNLQVDITKTRELLDWTPLVSVDDALRRTAAAFVEESCAA